MGATSMGALEIVQLINTGVVAYHSVAPLLTSTLETGREVTIEEVAQASGNSTEALTNLLAAIQRAKAEGR